MSAANSKNLRYLEVVDKFGPVPGSIISHRSGLTEKECNSIASRLIAKGRISRIKPKVSTGGGYYRYFLTEDQRDAFYRLRDAGQPARRVIKGLGPVSVVDRLQFLKQVKERTVFRDHPVLGAIIGDYERTLGVVTDVETV